MVDSRPSDYRVAVVTSTAADAHIARRVLQDVDIAILPSGNLDQLCAEVEAGLGAVVLAEEVLTSANMDRLLGVLERQPPWSGLPFIILTRPSGPDRQAAPPHARLAGALLIERPVRIEHLLSAIRSSLEARRRQYAMRDLLRQAQHAAEERAALQKAAEAANRMKDEFLAVLSHELRTPLNAIVGWASLLRRKTLTEEQMQRAVESIERNSRLQAQLIDDLLDVSRVISGSLRLETRAIELGTVVEEAMATVMPASSEKGVRLERGEWASTRVRGDSARLQQIAWNLLSNAIKFTPAGGSVRVEVRRDGRFAELRVIDSGEGIAPEFLPHVFERFWQADSTSTRTRGGLGLGLAIVKHLVELHGGSVDVASDGRGRGATFTVRLPLTWEETRAAAPEDLDSRKGNGATQREDTLLSGTTVLLVDDDTESLQVMATALNGSGAAVLTASSAEGAWKIARHAAPDVIVSDISMPHEDGYSFIRRVRADGQARARGSPAIALTAHARPEDREAALAAGFTAHLAKPVDPAELIRCILRCRPVRVPSEGTG
jgi:signal transduction histidine kinase/CheY-like chemotaxis protein